MPASRRDTTPSRESSRQLVQLISRFATQEGTNTTDIPGLRLARSSRSQARCPLLYEPSIIILAQGHKRLHVGDSVYSYDANNYLALAVPLPVECEFSATVQKPLLGMSIEVDLLTLGELLLEIDEPQPGSNDSSPRGIYASPLTTELLNAALRLLECLSSPVDSRVLGPLIKREIIYRVLRSEQGDALRAVAVRQSHCGQISRVLRHIHQAYSEAMPVEELARQASMSVSVFHHKFRAVTLTSPIQYIKSIRLHQARRLMTQEGLNAGSAAVQVGYESASQFNREFKRFFGLTPAQEAARSRSLATA